MFEALHEFGRISSIKADAIGEPGQRRFRLLIEAAGDRSAELWLEKEQLFNLGVAIKRLLAVVESKEDDPGVQSAEGEEMPTPSMGPGQHLDFQVDRMGVGFDDQRRLYIITAHGIETDEQEERPDVSLMASRSEVYALTEELFRVCAAGRPLCPLCSAPMGPEPHICPRHNGHGRLQD